MTKTGNVTWPSGTMVLESASATDCLAMLFRLFSKWVIHQPRARPLQRLRPHLLQLMSWWTWKRFWTNMGLVAMGNTAFWKRLWQQQWWWLWPSPPHCWWLAFSPLLYLSSTVDVSRYLKTHQFYISFEWPVGGFRPQIYLTYLGIVERMHASLTVLSEMYLTPLLKYYINRVCLSYDCVP